MFSIIKGGVKSSDGVSKKSVGRPNKLDENEVERLLSLYYERNMSMRELGRIFNVSRMTIWRVCSEHGVMV